MSDYVNAQWATRARTHIDVDWLGSALRIEARPGLIHYDAIIADGLPIADPTPTENDVIAERQRRLALGFDYDFGLGRGVHRIGTTEADMLGWDEVTKVAAAAIAVGQPAFPLAIVTDTGPVQVTAIEWQSILLAAAAFRQPIWAASFALQAMSPVPADFDDDSYWG